jgi:heme oxygenase
MQLSHPTVSTSGVKALDFKALRRLESLKEDMVYYYGENWREIVKPSPATKKYVDKIKTIAAEDPDLLIAHQYTRYATFGKTCATSTTFSS